VDEGSGLVRQAEITSANVHDFCLAEALIQGDEQCYFAGKAYSSQADDLAWRGRPTRLLEAWQRLVKHPLWRRARPRHDEGD
jgi:IS5 family transposase